MSSTASIRPGTAVLVDAIRDQLDRWGERPAEAVVAQLLRSARPGVDLLTATELRGNPTRIDSIALYADAQFSIRALVWQPGQETEIHDHVAWCVGAVLHGVEEEIRYRDHGDHLTKTGRFHNARGTVSGFAPPGDIHKVRNSGVTTAVSLHIYGADLRDQQTSVRRTYRTPVRPTTDTEKGRDLVVSVQVSDVGRASWPVSRKVSRSR